MIDKHDQHLPHSCPVCQQIHRLMHLDGRHQEARALRRSHKKAVVMCMREWHKVIREHVRSNTSLFLAHPNKGNLDLLLNSLQRYLAASHEVETA